MNLSAAERLLSPTLLVGLLLVVGCSENATKPKPQPEPHARSTLAGTIAFFAQAHKDEDIEDYIECLHPDYEFWFSEDDRTDPNWDWTDWITIVEDVAVTEAMFDAGSVTDVRMSLTNLITNPDSLGFYVGEETGGKDGFTYFWAIFGTDIHVVETAQEWEIDHWVDGRAYIYLRQDPNDGDLWTIWRIEDQGNVHKGTEQRSWSEIKNRFRK